MKSVVNTSTDTSKYLHSTDISNHRSLLTDLSRKLNVSSPEQWYTITHSRFVDIGAPELLFKYNNSLVKLLFAVYPEYLQRFQNRFLQYLILFLRNIHKWDPSKFAVVEQLRFGTVPLDNISLQRSFLEDLAKSLHIRDQQGWYKVSTQDIWKYGGSQFVSILNRYGSFVKLMSTTFSEYLPS